MLMRPSIPNRLRARRCVLCARMRALARPPARPLARRSRARAPAPQRITARMSRNSAILMHSLSPIRAAALHTRI